MQRTAIRDTERVGVDRDYAEDVAALKEQQAQMSSQDYTAAMDKLRKGLDRQHAKAKALTRKQDKLLFVGMYILLNLAEDLAVERKMIKKNLVVTLASTLTRSFEDLLILCTTFLKKLSTIQENKDDIRDSNIVETMGKFIPCSSQPLITISLRFLFNLSFDKVSAIYSIGCPFGSLFVVVSGFARADDQVRLRAEAARSPQDARVPRQDAQAVVPPFGGRPLQGHVRSRRRNACADGHGH